MKIKISIIILLIILLSPGCVIIKELIPQKPTASLDPDDIIAVPKSQLIQDEEIVSELFYIKGYQEKHTPDITEPAENLKKFLMETQGKTDLNRSGVISFYNPNIAPDNLKRIIIMIPGIYSSGSTLVNLAKSVKKRLRATDVWIWERRSNLLEDRRNIIKALKAKDPKILTDLIEDGKIKKEKAFYQPTTEDISFVGYWGLKVLMGDLLNTVKEARKRADEVVLCGYSLGVLYTTIFLANDFDPGEKVDPGYKYIDKVLLLDGPPIIDGYVKNEAMYKNGSTIIPFNKIEGIKKLESGKVYPCNADVKRDMTSMFYMDLKGALAYLDPDGISYELYDTGTKKLPITNLASYLIAFDNNYVKFKLFTCTFGRADAEQKGEFNYDSTVKVTGLSPGKKYIDWIPRQKGDKEEFNDYREYLKAACNLKYDMPEWYQPTRIMLDIGSIDKNDTSQGWQKKYFNVTENSNIDLPFLCVGLSRGLISRIDKYLNYKDTIKSNDYKIIMIDKITHLDGDTINDRGGRPVLADVIYNWLSDNEIVKKNARNIKEAVYP